MYKDFEKGVRDTLNWLKSDLKDLKGSKLDKRVNKSRVKFVEKVIKKLSKTLEKLKLDREELLDQFSTAGKKARERKELNKSYSKATRLVVVDYSGRAFDKMGVNLEMQLQDDGKTLKIFVND